MTRRLDRGSFQRNFFHAGRASPEIRLAVGSKNVAIATFFYAWCCHKALISIGRNFKLKVRTNSMGGLISWAKARR